MAVVTRFGWTGGLVAAYATAGLQINTGGFETTSNYRHLTNTGLGSAYGLRVGVSQLSLPAATGRWMCCDAGRISNLTFSWGWVFRRGGTDQFSVLITGAGAVELRRGGVAGAIVATSATNLVNGNFYWFAIELVAQDAGGTCNVYIGASPTPIVSFAGDTRNAGADGWDEISTQGFFWRWNDVIVDTAARWAETFTQACVVNSDVLVAGWTPSSGGTSFGVIDEMPWSSADYTGAVANNDELRCGHAALPAGVSVVGATALVYFARDGNIADANLLIVSGASSSYSGPQAGGSAGSYVLFAHHVDLDPATGAAWGVASLNAAVVGVRIET